MDQEVFEIELTDEQRTQMRSECGLDMKRLRYARTELVTTALFVEAVENGWRPPAGGAPVFLVLTAGQREALAEVLDAPPHTWMWIPEATDVTYAEDWDDLPAVRPLGERLVVTTDPSYEPASTAVILTRPPSGRPFGTGGHPTTQIAATLVERHVRSGDVVADIGTGSGILAIAAVKLGAERVVAYDIDESAVVAARENTRVNGLLAVIESHASPFDPLDGPFDLVIVNIYTGENTLLLPEIVRACREHARVILGGIPSAREHVQRAAAEAAGLVELERIESHHWVATAHRVAFPHD